MSTLAGGASASAGGGVATVQHDYASTGAYETIEDLGEIPVDEVWGISCEITAGLKLGSLVSASFIQLRGEADRDSGGSNSSSGLLTSGNMAGDTARVTRSTHNVLVQFRTTAVGNVKLRYKLSVVKIPVVV